VATINRLDRLTSIRGFAALYVVLFHCEGTIRGLYFKAWSGIPSKGYLAVDFFFVLSGFILAYVYAKDFDAGRFNYRRFLVLRLGRLYPVHLVTLVAAVLIACMPNFAQDHWLSNSGASIASNVFLMHAWGFHESLSWNFVSWSISAEWFAYLGFPLFALSSSWFVNRPFNACVSGVAALIAMGSIFFFVTPHAEMPNPADAVSMLRVSLEFLTGVLLYRAYVQIAVRDRAWAAPAAIALLISLTAVLHAAWTDQRILQDTIAVICMAGLILALALDTRLLGKALEWRPLIVMGEASYSIYMMHGLVFLAYLAAIDAGLFAHSDDFHVALRVALALIAISIASGFAVWRWVEIPGRELVRQWLDRPAPQPRAFPSHSGAA